MMDLINRDIISLLVAIVLVLAIFILEIINIIRKRPVTISRITVVMLIMVLVFVTFLTFQGKELTTADWAQMLPMLGLVVVTIFYAMSADRQASASVKMAEETREQRYSDSLPLLVPDVIPKIREPKLEPNEISYVELQAGVKVIWHNLGRSVAINIRFSLWGAPLPSGKVPFFPPRESQVLASGEIKEIDFSEWEEQRLDKPEQYQPRLEAEYRDIYRRHITTVQKFRIDERNEKAFLGEIHFTINGKRLGEESEHD